MVTGAQSRLLIAPSIDTTKVKLSIGEGNEMLHLSLILSYSYVETLLSVNYFLSCYPVDNASRVQVPDATEDLVEQIGHPLMVQVHVDHLAKAGIHQLHHQIP